jgi:hypothetical protein
MHKEAARPTRGSLLNRSGRIWPRPALPPPKIKPATVPDPTRRYATTSPTDSHTAPSFDDAMRLAHLVDDLLTAANKGQTVTPAADLP